MKVLAFDTATPATTVALDGLELRDDPAPGARPNHTSRLLELIEEVLARSGSGWADLDRVAVGIGPGTFTGLRIGIATAHALSRARGLPLVGVSTLQALALPASETAPRGAVMAILDARRGEVFAAAWGAGSRPGLDTPALAPSVLSPQALLTVASRLGPGSLGVGDGAVKFAADLRDSGLIVAREDSELHRVTAAAHCRLAVDLDPGGLGDVQPEYLRQPDAEIARRQ